MYSNSVTRISQGDRPLMERHNPLNDEETEPKLSLFSA